MPTTETFQLSSASSHCWAYLLLMRIVVKHCSSTFFTPDQKNVVIKWALNPSGCELSSNRPERSPIKEPPSGARSGPPLVCTGHHSVRSTIPGTPESGGEGLRPPWASGRVHSGQERSQHSVVRADAGKQWCRKSEAAQRRKTARALLLATAVGSERERKSSPGQQAQHASGGGEGVLGNHLQYSNCLGKLVGANVLYV